MRQIAYIAAALLVIFILMMGLKPIPLVIRAMLSVAVGITGFALSIIQHPQYGRLDLLGLYAIRYLLSDKSYSIVARPAQPFDAAEDEEGSN